KRIVAKAVPFNISVVCYMELVQGMRNKKELVLLKKYLKLWEVEIVQITSEISEMAMDFVEKYFLSNSMELQDALIASTSLVHNEILLTGNEKHYQFLPKIQINRFVP
ncbi:MAG: PIN domain-containing protein, partial [Fibromonadales bacterium]|nr:PIN domain-containing protein [Fibromonadales bacterium]